MKNRNKLILFIVIIFSSLLVGCFDVYINEKINSDGSSEIEIIYDFEKMITLIEFLGDSQEINEFSPDVICEDFEEDNPFKNENFETLECIPEKKRVIIKATRPINNYEIILNEDNTQSIKILKNNTFLNKNIILGDLNEETISEENPQDETIKIIYTIYFEDNIVESTYGEIEENKLIFNLTSMPKINEDFFVKARIKEIFNNNNNNKDPILVEKNENNNLTFILGGLGILILVSGVFIFLNIKKKKIEPTEKTSDITPRIKQLIEWIKTYENSYNKEILIEHLKKYNYTDKEIDEAYKNK